MTSSGQILDLREIKWNLYFWKAHDKSYPKIQFFIYYGQIFQKLWRYKCNMTIFDIGSYQIWPYHVTQAESMSFSYLKSYCPLNFRKSHQIWWFCYIPNGSYKKGSLKAGRICRPHVE